MITRYDNTVSRLLLGHNVLTGFTFFLSPYQTAMYLNDSDNDLYCLCLSYLSNMLNILIQPLRFSNRFIIYHYWCCTFCFRITRSKALLVCGEFVFLLAVSNHLCSYIWLLMSICMYVWYKTSFLNILSAHTSCFWRNKTTKPLSCINLYPSTRTSWRVMYVNNSPTEWAGVSLHFILWCKAMRLARMLSKILFCMMY